MPAWLLIVLAGSAAYATSLGAGFVFDDLPFIVDNPLARSPWPVADSFRNTIRPLVQWTFSLNYAIGGPRPSGYHAVNALIHLLAAVTLFGVLRRTFAQPRIAVAVRGRGERLALAASLLWVVHPLTTQSVTYAVQRAESLMGLWYLLTLYAAIRAWEAPSARRWSAVAVAACAAGALTKAGIATAPLMVILYDRLVVAGTFRGAWQRRWRLYAGLAVSWIILAGILLTVLPAHEPTAGFGVPGLSPAQYALTQPGVILHYFRLAVWPVGLCLDYGWPAVAHVGETVLPVLIIGGLVGVTALGAARGRLWALPALWCVLTLALTSSVIPVKDLAAEHRMYLPLAGLLVLAVVGADRLLGSLIDSPTARRTVSTGLLAAAVSSLALATAVRNMQYSYEEVMWRDVIAKRPMNGRAHNNLGKILADQVRMKDAREEFSAALRAQPDYADAHYNLGLTYAAEGAQDKADAHFREAVRLDPSVAAFHNALGAMAAARGDTDQAARRYREALRLRPDFPAAIRNLEALTARHSNPP